MLSGDWSERWLDGFLAGLVARRQEPHLGLDGPGPGGHRTGGAAGEEPGGRAPVARGDRRYLAAAAAKTVTVSAVRAGDPRVPGKTTRSCRSLTPNSAAPAHS
ncbi:hypothetical protein GCM10010521_41360 [Streptomyces rameus]|uniref:Uncharacterized protein n=1 Tax=Streptomyces rameus TaxID=68261 RepID=A0ABP6NIS7_9ACTN